jgi:hypothetical protein
MTSRYDYLQNPDDRRHVAMFRSAISVTIVAGLMAAALIAPTGHPGDTVGVELVPAEPSAVDVAADAATSATTARAAPLPAADDRASPDDLYPVRYMGQSGVQG